MAKSSSWQDLRAATVHRGPHGFDGVGEPGIDRLTNQVMADVELDDLGQHGDHLGTGVVEAVTGMDLQSRRAGELRAGADTIPFRVRLDRPPLPDGLAPRSDV